MFLAGAILVGLAPATMAADAQPPVLFGMDAAGVAAQTAAGVKPDYGTFWIGPWTLSSGWGGPDGQLTAMKNAGVTPAVHFYYWGDDISPSCVENGCWSSLHNAQKTRQGWDTLGTQMTDHLNSKMGGAPVVIFLESEFNKGGIETYEPFDGYMAAMADKIHAAYPNAIIVLGFGNWGSHAWGNFDRAAAASDMVGIQGMRGSTKQSQADMMTLYDGLLTGVTTLETKFPGQDIMLTDIAVSSYPEPGYLSVQRDVLKEVFDNMAVLKSHGVQAIIYRSWLDSPNMDLANYYGMAERYWGLANTGALKPSAQVWIDGVQAERSGATPTPTPTPTPPTQAIVVGDGVTTQAQDFATKQAGGSQSDGAAQGGSTWNLWSNGHLAQNYNLTGAYDLTVRARGTSAAGVAPHMDVYVGGAKVLAADPGTAYADYRVAIAGTGVRELRIAFTNDAKTATEDRNLLVDAVSFTRAPPPNTPPTAQLLASTQGLSLTADARASSDADGDALAYSWTFGDGATALGPIASHAYAAPGTYVVSVSVSDGKATAAASQSVTATQPNRAPTASFAAKATNLSAAFDGSASSDPDGNTLAYAWAFGDGTTGSGRTTTHTYATAGTFNVSLTVSDGNLVATASKSVTVVTPAPAPATATVTPSKKSNDWWVQVAVSPAASKVEVKAGSAGFVPLDKQPYGWTKSINVPKGTMVQFRVTAANGQTATTPAQAWLVDMAPKTATADAPAAPAFTASFAPKAVGNDWWVETAVTANAPIASVEAKINGGAWTVLPKTDWGNYAKSLSAPNGSTVTFRATSSTGAVSTGPSVTWT